MEKVYTVPGMKAVDFSFANGYVKFTVHEIDGHAIVYIEQ